MKVDFHFHLEEGPYSFGWLQRTAKALHETSSGTGRKHLLHSRGWVEQTMQKLQTRLHAGCFSSDWIDRYIKKGQAQGIEQFGVVDHLYRFVECKTYYEQHMLLDDSSLGKLQRAWLDQVCTYSIEEYLEGMRKAAKAYPTLAIGVEADYFEGGEEQLRDLLNRWELDYIIGSIHFYKGWGFDNPEAQDQFAGHSLPALYEHHFATVKKAIASGLFDMIAHLDNIKVFGFQPDEAQLIPMYRNVAAALRSYNLATEINTGLLYRYPVREMCPSPAFLQILFEHGVPITLSSDAHFPDDIGMHLDDAVQAAKHAGYKEIVYFRNHIKYVRPL